MLVIWLLFEQGLQFICIPLLYGLDTCFILAGQETKQDLSKSKQGLSLYMRIYSDTPCACTLSASARCLDGWPFTPLMV